MLRMMLTAAVLAALAVTFVPIAAAEQPTREPLPAADFTGQFCEDFEVTVRTIVNKEFITIFSDGGALITGALKLEVENLETGKTIEVNASGPGTITPDGSLLTGMGRWLLFGEEGDFGPGSPAEVTIVAGKITISFDAAGNVTGSTRQGHIVDLCAALAD